MQGTITLDPESLIAASPELGSPPVVYARLMEVIEDPRAGANEVAKIISLDAALTVRLLKLVNSAGFARSRQVESVSQAVNVVGMSWVRDLALTTSVTTYFRNVPPHLLHADDFWRHSLATAVAAKAIAGLRKERDAERFFVAGLLHDIGRLVLYVAAPNEATAIIDHATERGMLLHEAERELTGIDHGSIGGALMERWNMPESLIESVALHHHPEESEHHPIETSAVHLADALVHELGFGRSGETAVPPRSARALEVLGIDSAQALEETERQYKAAVGAFGMSDDA